MRGGSAVKTLWIVPIIAIALCCVIVPAQDSNKGQIGFWTPKASMSTARLCLSTCGIDHNIYAIGGGSGYTSCKFKA